MDLRLESGRRHSQPWRESQPKYLRPGKASASLLLTEFQKCLETFRGSFVFNVPSWARPRLQSLRVI